MPFELRDYQKDIVSQVMNNINLNKVELGKGQMIQSSAGSGKTVMMADIAKHFTDKGERILFLVHRTEIVQQARKTFKEYGVNMDLAMINMIQTYSNMLERGEDFKPDDIFIDEAHHSMSNTYRKTLNVYQTRSVEQHKNINLLFFTATPYRLDNKDFLSLVQEDKLICGPTTKELIDRQYLAPFRYYEPSRMDLSKLERKGKNGDYTNASMAEAVKNISPQDLVNTYRKFCKNGEQALIYAVNVETSKAYANAFNKAGIKAYHLDGASNAKERDKVIEEYRKGKVKVLSNVEIFTEGLDLPNASVAFLVRPTQSLSLYIQFAMRVMRYQPNKVAKIFDFAGLHDTFGLPDTDYQWSLHAENPMKTSEVGKTKRCPECSYIFNVEPEEMKQQFISCPACGYQMQMANPMKDSPFEEFYDEDIEQREIMINSFSELDTNTIDPRTKIRPQLPLYINYQLAKYQLAYVNGDNIMTFKSMLKCFNAPIYPTYYEIDRTAEMTNGNPNQEQIQSMIEDNNKFVQRLLDSQEKISISNPLKQNFEIVLKKQKAVYGRNNKKEALDMLFQQMKQARFREYYALNLMYCNPYQIKKMLDLEDNSEYTATIIKNKKILNTFFNSIKTPLNQVFNAKVTNIEQNLKQANFCISFKDSYGREYHQIITPTTLVKIAPQDKKKIMLETKEGYKEILRKPILAKPVKTSKNNVAFKLKAGF